MMVSEPKSRMPPRTFSFSPLISELTAITVVMPMTIPSTVSAERRGFLRRVSRANITCSFNSSKRAGLTMPRIEFARDWFRVWETVAILKLLGTQSLHGVQPGRLRRGLGSEQEAHAER